MLSRLRKYPTQTFLTILTVTIAIKIVYYFLRGYFDRGDSIIILFIITIQLILISVILIRIINSIISRSFQWKTTVLWVLLVSISIVPMGHFSTFGRIVFIYNANPTSVVNESRKMIKTYEPLTHFGQIHRWPLNNPRPLDEVPQIIKGVHKGEVLVLEHAVLLAEGYFVPSFTGFVIFQKGFDIWEKEKQITLLDFWFASWKIRIIDGMYWYSGNGYDNPFQEQILQVPIK